MNSVLSYFVYFRIEPFTLGDGHCHLQFNLLLTIPHFNTNCVHMGTPFNNLSGT